MKWKYKNNNKLQTAIKMSLQLKQHRWNNVWHTGTLLVRHAVALPNHHLFIFIFFVQYTEKIGNGGKDNTIIWHG